MVNWEKKLEFYSRKNELAFIDYWINDDALKQIFSFYKEFTSRSDNNFSSSDYYGGAFWPLYYQEGAGCSAFVIAMLELANILNDESRNWKTSVLIPMELIGGEFNQQKKIGLNKINAHKNWHTGEGTEGLDFIPFEIYDPTRMYSWILAQINQNTGARLPAYRIANNPDIPGLISDRRAVMTDVDAPIFRERPAQNLFIKIHQQNLRLHKKE